MPTQPCVGLFLNGKRIARGGRARRRTSLSTPIDSTSSRRVMIADRCPEVSKGPKIRKMAQKTTGEQEKEFKQLQAWLSKRGG